MNDAAKVGLVNTYVMQTLFKKYIPGITIFFPPTLNIYCKRQQIKIAIAWGYEESMLFAKQMKAARRALTKWMPENSFPSTFFSKQK